MLGLYVFSLILGGGLLVVSLFGDAMDADTGDMDFHVDTDIGLDANVHADVLDASADGTHALKVLSLRTLVYALFGFGAVGTVLSLRGSGDFVGTLALSVVGGVLSGGVVTAIFHYLRTTETGHHPGDRSLVGLSGTVTLPLSDRAPGTVVVERGNRRIALRALPHGHGLDDVGSWKAVVVVDMQDGVARVAPVEEDLALEP